MPIKDGDLIEPQPAQVATEITEHDSYRGYREAWVREHSRMKGACAEHNAMVQAETQLGKVPGGDPAAWVQSLLDARENVLKKRDAMEAVKAELEVEFDASFAAAPAAAVKFRAVYLERVVAADPVELPDLGAGEVLGG